MKTKILFVLLIIGLFLSSCIKEFFNNGNAYDEFLVVDGSISNNAGPYYVKLSKSVKVYENPKFNPYIKCMVEISDNAGNKEILKEVWPGVYKTDSLNGIQGKVGRKYQLKIKTPDGDVYESIPEEIKQPVGIKDFYGVYEHKDDPKLFYGRDGYQFYIDADGTINDSTCLLWRMVSTYKFDADNLISAYYDGISIKPVINNDTFQTCYANDTIKDIYLLNMSNQTQKQIINYPLWYEDNYSKALTIRYSLLVSQHIIGKNCYNYWSTIKKMNATKGNTFPQQPYQVKGNIIT